MDRRTFMLALSAGATLLGAAPMHAECGGPSATEFVEGLYESQARLQAQNTPLARDEFLALFSKGMRVLMQAPRRSTRQVAPGPALNTFFGWDVPPRMEISVGKVRLVSGEYEGPATVSVPLSYRGETHKVLVHVLLGDDGWQVVNIIYDNGKSLLGHYRALAGS